ncbi:MAG TPA: hypothetical protein VKF32_02680 [Thermoanaerobaculia bacterium]|nr:hypothetical protein [Thermoanaerobaculia bacterium]
MSILACAVAAALLGAAQAPTPAPRPASATPAGPYVTLDRIAAVVGDEVILESEVSRLVEVQLLSRRPGETDAAYRDRVLAERIDEILREAQLRRTGGLDPDPRDVEARLNELIARVEKDRGVPFDEVLRRARASRQEVTEWIKRGLALETYVRERISPTVKVTEAELKAYYEGPFRSEAKARGLEKLPPFTEVTEEVRELVRERKLNEEIERWTEALRTSTQILVYRR